MADEEESSEKPFDATPRKLEEARKRGDVPVSQDLTTALVYLGFIVAAGLFGLQSLIDISTRMASLLDMPHRFADQAFGGGQQFLGGLLSALLGPLSPWFGIPIIFAILAIVAQNALVFAPDRIKPKLNRISPISAAKQKFGRDGLFNFAKSFVKLVVYSAVLGWVAIVWAEDILTTPAFTFQASLSLAVSTVFAFLGASFLVTLIIGGGDYLWQRAEHLRKQRMSLKELRDESKETEGDPHTKQARRQRGYDIATNRMIADVPGADVVVVNPTHYAVALKWSRDGGAAPVCVAKGTDAVAARIREAAMEHGVPVHHDPPTARALHATVDLGQEIPPDHYRAVAAAIRFADAIRLRSKGP